MKDVKLKNYIFVNDFTKNLNKLSEQPIGVAKAWALAKFTKQVAEKYKIFEEQRIKILEKYGKKDKEGNYKFEKGQDKKAEAEMTELFQLEETYQIEPIRLDDDVKMSAKQLMMLEDLLVL